MIEYGSRKGAKKPRREEKPLAPWLRRHASVTRRLGVIGFKFRLLFWEENMMLNQIDTGDTYANIVDPDLYTHGVPHSTFKRLRDEEPVSWWEEEEGKDRAFGR